jgi:hypothetical protein
MSARQESQSSPILGVTITPGKPFGRPELRTDVAWSQLSCNKRLSSLHIRERVPNILDCIHNLLEHVNTSFPFIVKEADRLHDEPGQDNTRGMRAYPTDVAQV